MQVNGISALVTGGASGLGAATARALAATGATVHAVDLPAAWDRADTPPAGVAPVGADVTSEADVTAAVAAAAARGDLRLVVNCAGVGWASRILGKKGVHELSLFSSVIAINLVGTFNVLRLAAEKMAATEPLDEDGARGLIVNTASVAAFDGQIGQIAYAASKGGVAAMTLPAARDLAQYGIRVVTVAPGIIATPMMAGITPEFQETLAAGVPFPRRLGRPEEYAALVLSIAEHDYLNGETIRFDGALRMAPR